MSDRARCPRCGKEVAYLPLGEYCLSDGYLWMYRLRRWLFIKVGFIGIVDPGDVIPHFDLRARLMDERARDRAGEFAAGEASHD